MRDYKTKRLGAKNIVNCHSKLVAKDRRIKNLEHVKVYDSDMLNQGYDWFNKGASLEDAPEELRNNFNFINGFNKAQRLSQINDMLYNDGKNFFFRGFSLDEASDKMKNNPYFMKGYQDAENLEKDLEDLSNRHKR